ncbi:hypothetical protein HZB07_05390 [Candidatus Saganbacteria bacterium]|nr:hypothetical protein [Candidatus Saganbacteria bacterium]
MITIIQDNYFGVKLFVDNEGINLQKKIKYEKPELVDFSGEVQAAPCSSTGSSATDNCNTGTSATGANGCISGTSAPGAPPLCNSGTGVG